jgi:16S rRNA processing protein RimM
MNERRPERMVTLAAIVGAHGIQGDVRLKLFTDDIGPYRAFKAGDRTLTLTSLRGGTIARFEGIVDRNAAEGLRGMALEVPRASLPPLEPGEYYHADLIGLAVIDTQGTAVGRVVEIENFGAGDVIEIERPDSKRFMVPMRPEAVPEWDEERLVVDAGFAA